MTKLKIIQGKRRELEYQLLTAMFTPGGHITADALKQRLTARGKDRLCAVGATPCCGAPSSTPEPTDDQT